MLHLSSVINQEFIMKIYAISQFNQPKNYNSNRQVRNNYSQKIQNRNVSQPSFKGDKGALAGMLGGALLGLGIVAVTIATGGLAGAVAAVGATAVGAAGAGAGAQVGGIAGAFIEEALNEKDEKKKNNNK